MGQENGTEAVTPERVPAVMDEWGNERGRIPGGITAGVAGAVAEAAQKVRQRYEVARDTPRNWQKVRELMLAECGRPAFAEAARYVLPRGRIDVEGFSIRFAEMAIRRAGNIEMECDIVHDDAGQRVLRIRAIDLETNASFPAVAVIQKTVERKKLRKGQQAISERANSSGIMVFTVRADEGELLMKQQAHLSKALRTAGLRLIPGDILDECETKLRQTIASIDAQDPQAQARRLFDSFGQMGVGKADLKRFLGHATATAEDMDKLRGVYTAMREGVTWAEIQDQAGVVVVDTEEKPPPALEERKAQDSPDEGPKPSGLGLRPGAKTREAATAPPVKPEGTAVCAACELQHIRSTMTDVDGQLVCDPCYVTQKRPKPKAEATPAAIHCHFCQDRLEPDQVFRTPADEAACGGCLIEAAAAAADGK